MRFLNLGTRVIGWAVCASLIFSSAALASPRKKARTPASGAKKAHVMRHAKKSARAPASVKGKKSKAVKGKHGKSKHTKVKPAHSKHGPSAKQAKKHAAKSVRTHKPIRRSAAVAKPVSQPSAKHPGTRQDRMIVMEDPAMRARRLAPALKPGDDSLDPATENPPVEVGAAKAAAEPVVPVGEPSAHESAPIVGPAPASISEEPEVSSERAAAQAASREPDAFDLHTGEDPMGGIR